MHAKMTRDRKKLFINSVEKTIAELEQNNKRMREILAKQAVQYAGAADSAEKSIDRTTSVTPESSPLHKCTEAPTDVIPPLASSSVATTAETEGNEDSTEVPAALSMIA